MRKLAAFKWVPPFAQGLVRDLRIRWALEEAGFAYDTELYAMPEIKQEPYREHQPFGQIPYYVEDGVEMFESAAAVLYIAEQSEALLPAEPKARARALQWMIAAINSVEPALQYYAIVDVMNPGQDWTVPAKAMFEKHMLLKLDPLEQRMQDRAYLEDHFTAGDLMMTTVLRILRRTDEGGRFPALAAYRARCEARPAFQRALADQLAPFAENAPKETA